MRHLNQSNVSTDKAAMRSFFVTFVSILAAAQMNTEYAIRFVSFNKEDYTVEQNLDFKNKPRTRYCMPLNGGSLCHLYASESFSGNFGAKHSNV